MQGVGKFDPSHLLRLSAATTFRGFVEVALPLGVRFVSDRLDGAFQLEDRLLQLSRSLVSPVDEQLPLGRIFQNNTIRSLLPLLVRQDIITIVMSKHSAG